MDKQLDLRAKPEDLQRTGVCLAAMANFGQVYDCGSCGNIHVQVGMVGLALEPTAYMQLVTMISTSAANFELWLEQRSVAGMHPNSKLDQSAASPGGNV